MLDLDTIVRAPFVGQLLPAAQRAVAARAVLRRYDAGQVLWTAGDRLPGLVIVLEGRVRVVREARGRQHVVHTEGPGGTLGEVPLFAGGPAPATAIAAEDTRCVLVPREAIDAAIVAEPSTAWLLLQRLAERVRGLVERLNRLGFETTIIRLAGFLVAHAEERGGRAYVTGVTQTALAQELSTVREVVVRALRTLRERGLVASAGRGRLLLTDLAALRDLVATARD